MSKARREDAVRRNLSAPANAAVDSFLAGRVDRRSLLRFGTALGITIPALGLLGACGETSSTPASGGKAVKGGTLRVGVVTPTGPIDPMVAANQGAVAMFLPIGEYLARAEPDLTLRPALAKSWTSNDEGTIWTFTLRDDVTFQDGQKMTSADVVATFNRLADVELGSVALSAFRGIIGKGSASAVDELTVQFELDIPVGNFPYLVSSDTYSAIILPASFSGDYEKGGFPGTGPMRMKTYTADRGATMVRNEEYWDKANMASLDKIDYTFFADEKPALLAFQGSELDVVYQISVQNGRAVLNNPAYALISARSAAARVLHLRADKGPWTDKRVRQALALTVDRAGAVEGLMKGRADLGNDSPFAPVYPVTDSSVAQRKVDLNAAKDLLAQAGVAGGFKTTLNVINQLEIPDYAVLIKAGAAKVGIDLDIKLQDPGAYYGEAKFGKSPWLDATAGITDYGHRSIPNVYLNAQFQSEGVWNSSHIKNQEMDSLISEFVKTVDVDAQKAAATSLQNLFLEETPAIYSAFLEYIAVSTNKVTGIVPNATGQLFLGQAAFTA